ncbi:hypothetical protein PspLS_11470 [Pyricularia sp. CBS 133598]|nr:hypothetical protein PspLS_11470 [Pyricularia sp. CBS 133598]
MDMDGCTTLHLAVKHDSVDAARTLIELEVDTTIANAASQTAFESAASCDCSFADELDPNKHINGTDALQMKSQKLCLVRRVLDSIREIYMQGLVLETGLTSDEVETASMSRSCQVKISQVWLMSQKLQVAQQPKRTLLLRFPRNWWCFRKLETT